MEAFNITIPMIQMTAKLDKDNKRSKKKSQFTKSKGRSIGSSSFRSLIKTPRYALELTSLHDSNSKVPTAAERLAMKTKHVIEAMSLR